MKSILISIFILFKITSFSQPIYYLKDSQLWYNLYFEKKVTKRLLLHLNQETRFTNNISQFQLGYADMGITYKFTKHVKILIDYVFTQARRNQPYLGTFHQFYTALQFKQDIGRWRFMYRNMFQVQYNNPFTSQIGYIPYLYDRNKFTIKYEYNKRFTYYIAEELYVPLNNPQSKGLDRTRSYIGMFYTTFRHQQLEFYFLYQAQLQNGDWYNQRNSYTFNILEHDFIYGIGYSIEF